MQANSVLDSLNQSGLVEQYSNYWSSSVPRSCWEGRGGGLPDIQPQFGGRGPSGQFGYTDNPRAPRGQLFRPPDEHTVHGSLRPGRIRRTRFHPSGPLRMERKPHTIRSGRSDSSRCGRQQRNRSDRSDSTCSIPRRWRRSRSDLPAGTDTLEPRLKTTHPGGPDSQSELIPVAIYETENGYIERGLPRRTKCLAPTTRRARRLTFGTDW